MPYVREMYMFLFEYQPYLKEKKENYFSMYNNNILVIKEELQSFSVNV